MNTSQKTSRNLLILTMVIFGTVGVFRRLTPLPSSVVALVRGVIGTAFLLCYLVMTRKKLNQPAVKRYFLLLILSGSAIGFNWILLFEAYNYTSVATATLCYYLAPILVILAAPVVLKESLSLKRILCAAAALAGMVLVSGITREGFSGQSEWRGILFGIGAAVLYASVILMNQKMPDIPALDKTVFQLGFASIALLPYVLLTQSLGSLSFSPVSCLVLVTMGMVHTGLAYLLFFGAAGKLQSHTIALLSYIDPVLAIVLSAVLLRESMTIEGVIGAVLILGAAFISENGN